MKTKNWAALTGIAILGALCFLFYPSHSTVQPPKTGELAGNIVVQGLPPSPDTAWEAPAIASISICRMPDRKVVANARTDGNGDFQSTLKPGLYAVYARSGPSVIWLCDQMNRTVFRVSPHHKTEISGAFYAGW